jgi:hypothetical protein
VAEAYRFVKSVSNMKTNPERCEINIFGFDLPVKQSRFTGYTRTPHFSYPYFLTMGSFSSVVVAAHLAFAFEEESSVSSVATKRIESYANPEIPRVMSSGISECVRKRGGRKMAFRLTSNRKNSL